MVEFIIHLVRGARLTFSARQVCTDVQQLSAEQGARLVLLLALFRARLRDVQVPGGSFTVCEIILHPTAYREELCQVAYSLLKEIRQKNRDEMRSYISFGVSPSPVIREHQEISDLALSFLMSTVAVGCTDSLIEIVKYSWEYLSTFSPVESDIVQLMKMPEYIVNDIIEQPIETEEWLKMTRQYPAFVRIAA